MAFSLNKVSLIGNVGKPPEIRTMQDGKEMATFSIATSEVWQDKKSGEKKTKTEWHRVIVFSIGLVRIIKDFVDQGTKMYIEGSLQTRKYTGKDGVERTVTEVVLQGYNSNLILLDNSKQSVSSQVIKGEPRQEGGQEIYEDRSQLKKNTELMEELDDEVPF
ncbi:MAG: single-stranded DNA-binding protein [Rickettsiales bacterium]|nr:single-stranded DNA-binding protein [Rickettsiales bacterium]